MQNENQLLLESIRDYAIIMLNPLGHIATWNLGAERMKGYKEEEILGKHFSIFFTKEDCDAGKPQKELEVALAKGRYEEEGWRVRKEGARFWANVILTTVYSDTNEHIGYAKVTRDLSEKRRNEELYRSFVSQVKEYAIFMIDTNGDILTWNEGAERIKGYSAQEIIGKNFSTFYTDEDNAAGKPQKELEIALESGKYEEEGWRVRKDGSQMWANVVITPIHTDRHIGFAKVTRDLTRKKEIEQLTRANTVLEATNKELERFASVASHDLREPLRKISTFSNIILKDQKQPLSERHQHHLSKIISACSRMNALIEDILSFSTLSHKQHFEKYSLCNIAAETVEVLEQSIEEKNVVIYYKDLPEGIIIASQMRQLFQNFISNSIKFSKPGVSPVINITHLFIKKEELKAAGLWPSEQYLQLRFKDNGIGFEQQYAEKIFNVFDRLHSKTMYEGTGLGLAICKKIAENHGGIITAKSEVGQGSEFTLVIPA